MQIKQDYFTEDYLRDPWCRKMMLKGKKAKERSQSGNVNIKDCYENVCLVIAGLKWTTIPTPINKCIGQDVTFMWSYEEEAGEEIKQLKFIVNATKEIAYKSVRNGFNVKPEYKGRVEARNETGILLKNISAKDTGNYTLYPIIAKENSPNVQSIWLNVIAITLPQWCTCERFLLSTEWISGQTFSIVAADCHLEINSSFCCPKGPVIEYCVSDPQKLCVPIRNTINITESTTQSRGPNYLNESTSQTIVVPEKTNDEKDFLDPVDVMEEQNLLYLLVAITCMNIYLVICSLVNLLRKIYNQYKNGQKNHDERITEAFLHGRTADS
ncbi:hypothetical protein CHS0354_038649 [Potamilus streckersoni]|uniref:Uncharacterized protein n=1 Tax=Potamilus streckersoni TaxID=2493646 RepID=A0AAE0T7H2_9BIVA|nr:hypothetical protein CHS0354_038649 [Potamilus streckersoni]